VPAAAETIYEYVADLRNAPTYISAIREITTAPPGPPAVGQRFGAVANFLGQPAPLTLRLTTLDPGQQVSLALEGNPPGTLTINIAPGANGSSSQVEAHIDVPAVPTVLLAATLGGMLDESLRRLATALGG